MKKIFKLFIIFILFPVLVYSLQADNKQKELQRQNQETLDHLIMLGNAYNDTTEATIREDLERNIRFEVEHWIADNTDSIIRIWQEELIEKGIETEEKTPSEILEKIKENVLAEVKECKIPEIILKTLSVQTAETYRQLINFGEQGK